MVKCFTCKLRQSLGGFTLLEISIVLIIMATMVGVGVAMFSSSLEKTQYDITKQRMDAIQKALLDYRRAFHEIPCPADATRQLSDTGFGRGDVQDAYNDPCDDGAHTPNYNTGKVWIGGVPVRTLKLPDEYAFDGWGRRMMYVADQEVTGGRGFKYSDINDTVGSIVIADSTGATINSALYAIISYGPNGHGAFTRDGDNIVNASSVNTNELNNCGCDDTGSYTGHDATFIQGPYTADPIEPLNTFDDIVVYGTREQLSLITE